MTSKDMDGLQPPGLRVPVLAALLLGVAQAHPIPDSSPLLQFGGQVRQRHLYTDDAQESEVHLEIRADGTVAGTAHRSPESECGGHRYVPGRGPQPTGLTRLSPCRSLRNESLEARRHSDPGGPDIQVPVPEAGRDAVRLGEAPGVTLTAWAAIRVCV